MVSLGPLFDFSASASEASRDRAISTVGAHAGPEFMEQAKAVIQQRLSGTECLAEEFRRVCEDAGIKPNHHNAWGSLTNQLVKAGILIDTGRLGKSTSLRSHARRQPIWRVR
jgi:hypothetical protein